MSREESGFTVRHAKLTKAEVRELASKLTAYESVSYHLQQEIFFRQRINMNIDKLKDDS
jgi:hypothetical protein|nr:hypothetical protein [Phascolarctobacterium succinatutens]